MLDLGDLVEELSTRVRRYGSKTKNALYIGTLALGTLYNPTPAQTTTTYGPEYATTTPNYVSNAEYEQESPMFYVHTPPWVTMKGAYREEMGGAFGLAFLNTGLIMYDITQSPSVQQEIKLHELIHQLYPSMEETQVRATVVAILGEGAELHNEMGQRGV